MPERAVPAVFVSRNLNKREHPSGGLGFRKHQHQGRGIRRFFQQKGPQAGTENLLAGDAVSIALLSAQIPCQQGILQGILPISDI